MYYITTPIYYVNDKPHIGHAYTTLACDVLARWHRLKGEEVFFLTGTDEHGQKIEQSAVAAGKSPQEFTDEVSQHFRDLLKAMNISNDQFIRTTEARHHKAAQKLWQVLQDKGDIYEGTYAGWYSVKDEAYFAESELVDGKAPSGHVVEWVEEPSYFFKLSAYKEPLLEFYKNHPDFVAPKGRYNEVKSFVEGELHDLAISRTSFKWGVKVPGTEQHIMYVWFEALVNYLTAAGYPDDVSDQSLPSWPADVHMVGKDILRFHAVYWPAFLLAADLPVVKRVFAHGWWTNEGKKISKSLGNAINPYDLLETYGLDQTRYFLLREVPFGNDGDFSHAAIQRRMSTDLANDLGNLCQRVLSMVDKRCERSLSTIDDESPDDTKILNLADALKDAVNDHLQVQAFHKALESIWQVVSEANKYIDTQAPWTLRKTDPNAMRRVLSVLVEVIRKVAIVLRAFIPISADEILNQLNVSDQSRALAAWDETLPAGHTINTPTGIFPRWTEDNAAA